MRNAVKMVMPLAAAACLAFTGCGKSNVFSWTHNPGSSSDVKSLQSDANAALQAKDYQKALEYYQKIIESDPQNAEAIYGEAAAELANAGIDIATLVSNLVKNTSGSGSAPHLAPAIAAAANAPSSGTNILPDTIISNLSRIRTAVNNVLRLTRLPLIIRGQANGSIPPDNPDVNLNLAFCYILHAALILNDLVVFDSDYQATVKPGVTGAQLSGVANEAAEDLVNAYNCMRTVVIGLHLADDGTIAQINADVKDLFDQYKALVNGAPYYAGVTASIN